MIHVAHDGLPAKAQIAGFAPLPDASTPLPKPQPSDIGGAVNELWLQRGARDNREFSQALSELTGRTVLVIDLGAMPHAPTVRRNGNHAEAKFTPQQLDDRARYLEQEARATFPNESIWDNWRWRDVSATICTPNIDELLVRGGPKEVVEASKKLPGRLAGDCWDSAAVIFAPDRRWTPEQDWALITGLGRQMERWPPGKLVQVYEEEHETAHLLQRRRAIVKVVGESWPVQRERWVLEFDGDMLPVTQMRARGKQLKREAKARGLQGEALTVNRRERRELLENAVATKHMRAISGFLNAAPRYWVALAMDNPKGFGLARLKADTDDKKAVQRLRIAAARAANRAFLTGYELRWRVAAQLEGKPLTDDSASLQAKILDWRRNPGPSPDKGSSRWELNYWFSESIVSRAKNPKTPDEPKISFHWNEINDVRDTVPALQKIIASGAITDPQTMRLGELVVQAAHYFKPSLKAWSFAPSNAGREAAHCLASCEPSHGRSMRHLSL